MSCFDKMIPQPKLVCDSEIFSYYKTEISGDFPAKIKLFCDLAKKLHNLNFTEGDIITAKKDASLAEDEYTVVSDEDGIRITAGGDEGASHAFATLLQLMWRYEGKMQFSHLQIHDRPDSGYRGIMIDCARNHHPVSLLKKYVDMCWFYKIKFLHLHLSDDQAYTLPSDIFPKLTTPHNCFSRKEINDLVEYAHLRGVQIVPEIDTPGHSTKIREAYPEIFGELEVMEFSERSIGAAKELFGEICRMFPYSEYIHMGADEANLMDWNNSEKCIEYGLSLGIDIDTFKQDGSQFWRRSERFLVHYINEISEVIVKNGRKPIVWEGFHRDVNEYITRDVTVMVFESLYQLAHSLINDGFKVINCSWRPTYVVVPAWFWGKTEAYNWDIGSFSAVHPQSPYYGGIFKLDSPKSIIGGQLNSWGDTLASIPNGLEEEFERIFEDAPAIAENTWNKKKRGDYNDFVKCDNHCASIFRKIIK